MPKASLILTGDVVRAQQVADIARQVQERSFASYGYGYRYGPVRSGEAERAGLDIDTVSAARI